jgi:hypothetical protein
MTDQAILPYIPTPPAPEGDKVTLYAKSDGLLYQRPTGGVENPVEVQLPTDNVRRVPSPRGAAKSSINGTGLIKVTLPVGWTNSLLDINLVFVSTSATSFDIVCKGFTRIAPPGWANTKSFILANPKDAVNHQVQFGYDGFKCCIYIGSASTVWSDYSVSVSEVTSHRDDNISWNEGWVISLVSSTGSDTIDSTERNTQVGSYTANVFTIGNEDNIAGGGLIVSRESCNQVNITHGASNTWGLLLGYGDGSYTGTYHGPNNAAIINVQNAPLHLGANNKSVMQIYDHKVTITNTNSSTNLGLTTFEIITTDNSPPSIALHRAGYSAVTLSEAGNQLYVTPFQGSSHLLWHAGNDGSGSGLDADMVDGVHAAQLAKLNTHNTYGITDGSEDLACYAGAITQPTNYNLTISKVDTGLAPGQYPTYDYLFKQTQYGGYSGDYLKFKHYGEIQTYTALKHLYTGSESGIVHINKKLSGETADYCRWVTLLHPVWVGPTIDLNLCNGTFTFYRGSTAAYLRTETITVRTATAYNANSYYIESNDSGAYLATCLYLGVRYVALHHTSIDSLAPEVFFDGLHKCTTAHGLKTLAYYKTSPATTLIPEINGTLSPVAYTGNKTVNGSTFWTSGNDGSGSGLDADKLDGLEASSFVQTGAVAQTIEGTKSFTNDISISGLSIGAGPGSASNTCFGYLALSSRTTGSSNVAIGWEAQRLTNVGSQNVAIGDRSLTDNVSGSYNTALGYEAAKNMYDGDYNVCVGYRSGNLINNSYSYPADNNVFIGARAADQMLSGSNNIIIGFDAEASTNDSCNNEVTIGNANITRFRVPGLGIDWNTTSKPPVIVNPPASPTASGTTGQIAFSTAYLYICVATNTWKRVAISSW